MQGRTNCSIDPRSITVTLINHSDADITVTAVNGDKTMSRTVTGGTVTLTLPSDGVWTLTATSGARAESNE